MLHEKSMLVYLSFGQPTLKRKDKAATRELTDNKGADADAADVVKNLFGSRYRPISEFINKVRTYHYEATLPWLDSGMRIISAMKYMAYTETMRGYRAEWERQIAAFLQDYDEIRLAEEVRMAGLLDENDYPTRSQLASRFRFELTYYPVPTTNDFRLDGISEIEMEKIRLESNQATAEAGRIAMQEAYSRLSKVVKAAADVLSSPGKIFRDSLIENIQEAVTVLPDLNVTGDPQFDVMLEEVRTRLAVHSPDTLRLDQSERAKTAAAAAEIFARMEAYI